MQLDFWNQPLVVKAIRVKYRGSQLFLLATAYLSVLLIVGMIMYRYMAPTMGGMWIRYYVVGLFITQFVISTLIAASAVSVSMQTEVATRTLDFQRIAAIKPIAILLGKAIGEPASSYLLSMATIPVAVFCVALGALHPLDMIVLYVTLATTTFMIACISLLHSLDPNAKAAGRSGAIGGMIFLIWLASSIGVASVGARGPIAEFVIAMIGLFTPVLSIAGLATANPATGTNMWAQEMAFFGLTIPYAALTPFFQMGASIVVLVMMKRRLTRPLDTSLSKLEGYGLLSLLGVLWAGFQFDAIRLGSGLTDPATRFAAGFIILAFLVIFRVTPSRETALSWTWRLRGRRPLVTDLLIGERTVNVLWLLLCWLIGVTIFAAGCIVPAGIWMRDEFALTNWGILGRTAVVTFLVIMAYGLFLQALSLLTTKGAGVLFLLVSLALVMGPFILGEVYALPVLSSMSPLAYIEGVRDTPVVPAQPLWFVLVHAAAAVFWGGGTLRVSRKFVNDVDRKLVQLGVGVGS